ncbi:MAG: NAD-dependent epimerase/dehydratase family protein [Desulfuromonadales bacterium]|nr:MAG: NAD-dependent epimerase/dehydratase family protein [Desulfuromonadales bacterium]
MATVLVTGGAGFIGSHVVDELLKKGHRVVVLDDLSGGSRDNVNDGATFVEGSILDLPLLEELFEAHRFEYVFHLAAYAAEGLSHYIKRFVYSNNLIGSVNLINLAVMHSIKCFVFSSSIAVYGAAQLPLSEDMTPRPEDTYGISKYAVELELAASHRMFGLDSIVFRPHNVYGERQNIGDAHRNVVGIFMNQIMQGRPVTIYGDGTQTRAFSHISDVAPVMAASIDNEGAYNQVFNIGADQPFTILELMQVIAREMGAAPEAVFLEKRDEVLHAVSSHGKLRRHFDVPEPLPLAEGIRRMALWAKSVGPRRPRRFEGLEITKNLPPAWD